MIGYFPDEFEVEKSLVYRFLNENPDLDFRSPNGIFVELVESIGFIEILIRIDPDTTITAIRNSSEWIIEWRDRVHRWNDQEIARGQEADVELRVFQYLDQKHKKEGLSYQSIAELVNTEIVEWIEISYTIHKELISQSRRGPEKDSNEWRKQLVSLNLSASDALENARSILRVLGFPKDEIELWIKTLSDEFDARRSKFLLKKEPVNREKIRNWLEYRRKSLV